MAQSSYLRLLNRIMLGFMVTTMFLSVWICNTSTTAMMMPIVDAVLTEIFGTRGRTTSEDLELASYSQKATETSMLEKRQCHGSSEKSVPIRRKSCIVF